MADQTSPSLAALRHHLQSHPDGVLEEVAAQFGVSLRDVAHNLPEGACVAVAGTHFVEVMTDVATWGDVTLLVHTPDIILECTGPVPAGKIGRGYFNLLGGDAVGGHIRHQNCVEIHFLSRPFMGKETRSIVFFNGAGGAMFKIFVGRDASRNLRADQLARFDALRTRLLPGDSRRPTPSAG